MSSRTIDGQFHLRPSKALNNEIGAILATAQARYQIELFDFVFMSNHIHLVARSRTSQLPAFMQYLKTNIAFAVNDSVGRDGPAWESRYTASPILDEGAQIERALYMYAHGVKEGLVARAEQWPGIASVKERLSGSQPTYQRLDRSALTRATFNRKKTKPSPEEFTREVQVELSPWPFMRGLSAAAMKQRTAELVDQAREQSSAARRGKSTLGVRAILAQDPHSRPQRALQKRPRPLCHAQSPGRRKAYEQEFATFVEDYRSASLRFRAGHPLTRFPRYSYRPQLPLDWAPKRGTGPPASAADDR